MTEAVRERYARFAECEAPGRSDTYAAWAAGIASDAGMLRLLARIDARHRQPPLVFAVSRLLGAPLGEYAEWRAFVRGHADALIAECERRTVQASEPLRLAALLPALSEIEGPVALLELGAAAGLCLYPDRYSYRFLDERGTERARLDPADGPSPVMLSSTVRGPLPALRLPEVVWRGGVDLAPLDVRDAADRAWMQALIWPGEHERAARIAAASDIAAADPPLLRTGDAIDRIDELAASAPRDATLVITTPGMLVYLPWPARRALIERICALDARWITIDDPGLHDAWQPPIDPARFAGFAVALDGRVCADADPLGRWWEWRPGSRADAA